METLVALGLCKEASPRWPGAHATHIERRHLEGLAAPGRYYVADKSDGRRGILVLSGTACILDRAFVRTDLIFSGKTAPHVLDGELVNIFGGAQAFLVYDALAILGSTTVMDLPLPDRLAAAVAVVSGLCLTKTDGAPLNVVVKSMVPAASARAYVAEVLPTLPYATDGIVLTPANEPVRQGTCDSLLKWKPADSVTVDFEIRNANISRFELFVIDKDKKRSMGLVTWRGLDGIIATSALEGRESAIIECRMRQKGAWCPVRVRLDKDRPNNWFVYKNTLKNIEENILLSEILDAIDTVGQY